MAAEYTNARPLLESALRYAEANFAVFPGHSVDARGGCTCGKATCSSPGKHPRIKEWQFKASKDPATIRRWWQRWPTANVCIATGQVSGIVVLDVDPRHGGVESLRLLEQQHGPLPDTLTVCTGGGGRHFYFAHPGVEVGNKAALLPGLDIRGDGGFVVAPPSLHQSGKEYSWA